MIKTSHVFVIVLLLASVVGCADGKAGQDHITDAHAKSKETVTLTVSAAVSLTEALEEIKMNFEKNHPDVKLSFNFGSSGALKQQIEQGAPVDLFFSAAEDKFDELADRGMIVEGTALVNNDVVLIIPTNTDPSIYDFSDLQDKSVKKLAIGTPESVPAGKYAKQILEHDGLWDTLSHKIVYGKDVRQVLSYVETGNVDAGIVYKTDALISDKVQIVATASNESHTPVIYPVGIINNTEHMDEAQAFYAYIQTSQALDVLKQYGFTVD